MGNKMKIITLILILLIPSISIANGGQTISNIFISDDTDGNTIIQKSIDLWIAANENIDVGIAYRHSIFEEDNSDRLGILLDKRFNNRLGINADIGLESLNNELTGNAGISRWHDHGTFEVNIEKDFVDNIAGIERGLSFTNAYILSEYNIKNLNTTAVLGNTRFSDNNNRKDQRIVLNYNIIDGIAIRLDHQRQNFDNPSNLYFTPNRYYRTLAGITFATRYHNIVFRGQTLAGQQTVEGNAFTSYLARLSMEKDFNRYPISMRAELVFDRKQPEYTYKELKFTINYRF